MIALLAMVLLPGWGGAMRVTTPADPLTDKRQVYAIVGDANRHLAIGCDVEGSKELQVVLKLDRYIGTATPGILAGGQEITYRFDQLPARSVRWASSDDTITGYGKMRPMPFVLQMKGTGTVFIRTIRSDGEAFEIRFNYDGATEAIEAALLRCGFDTNGIPRK